MNLRFADEHDAAACLAIYAQYIDTSITFETALPSEDEFAGRIRSYGAVYPWLIAEEDGEILAYAYAHRAQERAAYDWNAELSVYVSKNAAGMLGGRKTVICEFLGTGMISVMPVPLLSVHPRECSQRGHIRYVPSVCAYRWTCRVLPHKPPLQVL